MRYPRPPHICRILSWLKLSIPLFDNCMLIDGLLSMHSRWSPAEAWSDAGLWSCADAEGPRKTVRLVKGPGGQMMDASKVAGWVVLPDGQRTVCPRCQGAAFIRLDDVRLSLRCIVNQVFVARY